MPFVDQLVRKFGEEPFSLAEAAKALKKGRKSASSTLSRLKALGYVKRIKEGMFRLTALAVHGRDETELKPKPKPVYHNITLKKPLPLNMETVERHYVEYECSMQDIANICDVGRYEAMKFLKENNVETRSRIEQTDLNFKVPTYNIKFKSQFPERNGKQSTKTTPKAEVSASTPEKTISAEDKVAVDSLQEALKDCAWQWITSDPQRQLEFTRYLTARLSDSSHNGQRRHS